MVSKKDLEGWCRTSSKRKSHRRERDRDRDRQKGCWLLLFLGIIELLIGR